MQQAFWSVRLSLQQCVVQAQAFTLCGQLMLCRCMQVEQLLQQIPAMFATTQIIDTCGGAAIQAAMMALQVRMPCSLCNQSIAAGDVMPDVFMFCLSLGFAEFGRCDQCSRRNQHILKSQAVEQCWYDRQLTLHTFMHAVHT